MATTINASASSGLITTADTSTILQLQTGGTTALAVSAAQVVTLTNPLPVASGGSGGTTSTGTGANVLGTTPSFTSTIGVGGATAAASGAGITFPAAVSASSDANTLDDYEEGTWTPSSIVGTNLTGVSWSAGSYTKVGRLVTLFGYANCTVTSSNTLTYLSMTGAPFTAGIATSGSAFLNNNVRSGTSQISSTSVYTFFSAASAPVAGAEIIQFSITYTL
jgi:hypothetical protein